VHACDPIRFPEEDDVLARSLKHKIVATCGAVLGFSLLYEVTTLDSQYAARQAELRADTALPAPGLRLRFAATAYCRGETTASGTAARTGIAAADPTLLPVGSVVHVDSLGPKYNGIYTVMDTGPKVQGRHVDIYMWNCDEAVRFGRRSVQLRVLRLGWSPQASAGRADLLFRRRESAAPDRTEPAPAPDVVAPASAPAPPSPVPAQ
jgi:3D (Asp-Asp-Asp) domain-containing protein